MTALEAVKLLPKGSSGKVALIEGREGKPSPDRWHILTHDPKEENGLHEYVVAGSEIVASRSLSQFAESLTADDVFGDVVKIDSDKVAKLAQQYAQANNLTMVEMNFELKKDGAAAAPLWNVSCLDAEGNEIGHLVLTATKGTVVSHEGFNAEPTAAEKAKDAKETGKETGKETAKETAKESTKEQKEKESDLPPVAQAEPDKKPAESERKTTEPRKVVEVRKAEPVADNQGKPNFLQRAGSALQHIHIFSGHDSSKSPTPAPNAPPPQ